MNSPVFCWHTSQSGRLGRVRWRRLKLPPPLTVSFAGVQPSKFSVAHASALRILYGGSVKPDNIKGLMAQEELDGALGRRSKPRPEIVRVDRKFSWRMIGFVEAGLSERSRRVQSPRMAYRGDSRPITCSED